MSKPLVGGRVHRFPDDEITWVGECPWTGNYCFGTENGNVLFYKDNSGGPFTDRYEMAEEAINGVAFYKNLIGVSTRGEVNIHRLLPGDGRFELIAAEPGGAHGISVTPDGLFVAPRGKAGLLRIQAGPNLPVRASFQDAKEATLNYYVLSSLGRSGNDDIFACAARTDGLLTITIDKNAPTSSIVGMNSPKVDFVDVCSIHSPEWPFAVAALCLDRSLIFVRNVLSEEKPRSLRFEGFRGTPYSILSADGHLIVLTSQEIMILPNLASRYLNGEKLDCPMHYRKSPVQAVDAFIAHGNDLMILTDDGVSIFEISKLAQGDYESKSVTESQDPQNWAGVIGIPTPVTTSWDHLVA
jgi:hypothetical protein